MASKMAKQYQKYCGRTFGIACSKRNCCALLREDDSHPTAVVPALDNVALWNLRTHECERVLFGEEGQVTALTCCSTYSILAVGHESGSIALWDLSSSDNSARVVLKGHKSAVNCLLFDGSSAVLVSGGQDGCVALWDILNDAGLYKLIGHKAAITSISLAQQNILVTSSKDSFVKFWDLDTQHCFHTIVDHRSEVWSFEILKDCTRLITGSSNCDLRVYQLCKEAGRDGDGDGDGDVEGDIKSGNEAKRKAADQPISCSYLGTVRKMSHDRVINLKADVSSRLLLCHTTSSSVEPFIVRTEEELSVLNKKRLKKARKAVKLKVKQLSLEDEIVKSPPLKCPAKIKSISLLNKQMSNEIQVLLCLASNEVFLWTLAVSKSSVEMQLSLKLNAPAHPDDVRTVAFSSDDCLIASGSSNKIHIWDRTSLQSVASFSASYALCSAFVPGNKYLLVGCKSGKVEMFDLGTLSLIDTLESHSQSVWALDIKPDRTGFVTGSADSDVKFWDFELSSVKNGSLQHKLLKAVLKRTLKMTGDVLALKHSPNSKHLAVALLDSTVKLFYCDSLKFCFSLYGHRLPVLCLDISSDSTLLVSGSADKNIKIWGLDYGDCHRSIFAHDSSIMALQFVPNTHLVFSASKDKTVKFWDVDNFQRIDSLQGHHGDVWCLAVSHDGDSIVTGSHDCSLRIWNRSDEILVLSEEQDKETEAVLNEELLSSMNRKTTSNTAAIPTEHTIQAVERITECMELYRAESAKLSEYKASSKAIAPPMDPVIVASQCQSVEQYVLQVFKRISTSDLEGALLQIPFSYVYDLVQLLKTWISNGWEIEMTSRCLFYLLKINHKQIVATTSLTLLFQELQESLSLLTEYKKRIGFNIAAIKFCQRQI